MDSSAMKPKTIIMFVVLGTAVLLLPHLGGKYYAHLFSLVFVNVMLAASLRPSLLCGQLNIGHSAFMSIGAYTSALLAKKLELPFELSLVSDAIRAAIVALRMA